MICWGWTHRYILRALKESGAFQKEDMLKWLPKALIGASDTQFQILEHHFFKKGPMYYLCIKTGTFLGTVLIGSPWDTNNGRQYIWWVAHFLYFFLERQLDVQDLALSYFNILPALSSLSVLLPFHCFMSQHSIACEEGYAAQDSQVLQSLEHVELSPVDIHESQHCYKKTATSQGERLQLKRNNRIIANNASCSTTNSYHCLKNENGSISDAVGQEQKCKTTPNLWQFIVESGHAVIELDTHKKSKYKCCLLLEDCSQSHYFEKYDILEFPWCWLSFSYDILIFRGKYVD